jgi:hypothetical protein
MADIIYIAPNFGIKKFQTEAELIYFLKKFSFRIIIERPTRDVWETTYEPKRRAIAYKSKTGFYVAAQLNGRGRKPNRRRISRPHQGARCVQIRGETPAKPTIEP